MNNPFFRRSDPVLPDVLLPYGLVVKVHCFLQFNRAFVYIDSGPSGVLVSPPLMRAVNKMCRINDDRVFIFTSCPRKRPLTKTHDKSQWESNHN